MSLQKAFSFDGLVRCCFLQKDYILFHKTAFFGKMSNNRKPDK